MSIFGSGNGKVLNSSAERGRSSIVSVLDVGTTKVCCLIARLDPRSSGGVLSGRTHNVEVLGIGHQRSLGLKSGVVIDLDKAEQSIRMAVDQAERMAGLTVESLIVNVSAGRLSSEAFSAETALDGSAVSDRSIQKVLRAGSQHNVEEGRSVLHSIPIGYALDGNRGIRDPRGMIGENLSVDMHVVKAETAPLRNLELCINRSHLALENLVVTPYASGLAALVDDESEMGAACIDMGGGTTTLSIFLGGHFVYSDAIAIGGNHVTMDIARCLSTRLDDAERLKVLHGSALSASTDDRDVLSVPPIGDDGAELPQQISKAYLTKIVRPRVEEILELIRDRLNRSGFASAVGKRIVLTGGASQLTGMGEVARRILTQQVRLGRPLGVAGLPEAAKGPAFSTAVGLLIYPQVAGVEQFSHGSSWSWQQRGALSRVGQWLKESF
jgi:cell division protein FtsA